MTTQLEPTRRNLAVHGPLTGHGEPALELEADAARYPASASDLLFAAAAAWRRAGEQERAIDVLRQLVEAGEEDAQFARVELAEVCFDLGRDDDAHAELAAVASAPRRSPAPCEMAAELLEERGELALAAEWYDAAASALTSDKLATLDREPGWVPSPAQVLLGRLRVRRLLGLSPDELDRVACRARERATTPRFPSADELLAGPTRSGLGGREVQTLFWQRAQLHASHERWPDLFDDNGRDPVAYHRRLEDRFRRFAGLGVARITLVPGTAEGLDRFAAATGGHPGESSTRYAYMCELVDAGETISWPPPRNGRCWCGSRSKYKKCCGSPC